MEVRLTSDDYVEIALPSGSLYRAQGEPDLGLMVVQASTKPRHDERGIYVDGDTVLQDQMAGTQRLWAKIPGRPGQQSISVFEER